MLVRRLLPGFVPVPIVQLLLRLGLLCGILLGMPAEDVAAQRPFQVSDPFYRGETARRTFFDRYALTGEVSYQSAGALESNVPASSSDLAFRFRFDYELAKRLDLGAVFDAIGGAGSRRLTLSWLVLKYYRYLEESNSDYAFRLAVDPASDGRVGFPQVDLAFVYTSPVSPMLMSDFAIGLRRVNIGYLQFIPPAEIPEGGNFVVRPRPQLLGTRALGTELHVMMNYNLHFDPAGSNLFVTFLGEAGNYNLVESVIQASNGNQLAADLEVSKNGGAEERMGYRGGTIWVRFGVEFNRPSYQVSPFLGTPLKQWTPEAQSGDWPEARLHFGMQLTLR